MRRMVAFIAALAALAGGALMIWRRNPRTGTRFVNAVVNPALMRRRLVGAGASELGTLEHVGRKTGIRRLTPVHPEPTPTGFRIMVPLGPQSEWARNVLAAGHCRLQLRDVVYDLDEPALMEAGRVDGLPRVLRGVMSGLGFEYLILRTFGSRPGSLDPSTMAPTTSGDVEAGPAGAALVPEPAGTPS